MCVLGSVCLCIYTIYTVLLVVDQALFAFYGLLCILHHCDVVVPLLPLFLNDVASQCALVMVFTEGLKEQIDGETGSIDQDEETGVGDTEINVVTSDPNQIP
eukprot:GHVQ01008126.1.p1 GENE.GHVQ01008126.1~~GHVQ01008126.1.p1  ORF type:complete len:102 (+),score=15.54 GHVQ01008126.1:278-583(+)